MTNQNEPINDLDLEARQEAAKKETYGTIAAWVIIMNHQESFNRIVGRAFEYYQQVAEATRQQFEDDLQKHFQFKNTNNPLQAPREQLMQAIYDFVMQSEIDKSLLLQHSILSVWLETHQPLQTAIGKFLEHTEIPTGVLKDGPNDETQLVWKQSHLNEAVQKFVNQHPKAHQTDVAVTLCYLTTQIPYPDESLHEIPDQENENNKKTTTPPNTTTQNPQPNLDNTSSTTAQHHNSPIEQVPIEQVPIEQIPIEQVSPLTANTAPLKWDLWLAELQELPSDAPDWDGVDDFIERVQQLASKKQKSLLMADRVKQNLTTLINTASDEMAYFGFTEINNWNTENIVVEDPETVIKQLTDYQTALTTHSHLRQLSPGATFAEDKQRADDMNTLQTQIFQLQAKLSTAFAALVEPQTKP